MAEQLFECGVCNCNYRISARECPRCGATNESRKKYHGGFYAREDVMANFDYILHNEHYNAEHVLKSHAFVPLTVPCIERRSWLSAACPAGRTLCANCMKCDCEESRALDFDVGQGNIRVIS